MRAAAFLPLVLAACSSAPAGDVLWSVPLGFGETTAPVAADGVVYVGTNNRNPRDPSRREDAGVLLMVRESDGAFLAQHLSTGGEAGGIPRGAPLVDGGRLWYADRGGALVCLDRREGRLWSRDIDARGPVAVIGERIYVGTDEGLLCLHGDDGRELAAAKIGPGPGPVADGKGVCVATDAGVLLAFDESLRERWRVDVGAPVAGLPVRLGGKMFASGARLCAVDAPSGRLLWERPLGSPARLAAEGARVVAAEESGRLSAFDAESGRELWSIDALSSIRSAPLLEGGLVVAATADDELRIVDVGDPSRVHVRPMPGAHAATPVRANGTLYVAAEGWLTAIRGSGRGAGAARAADSPFVATPADVVTRMLDLARPGKGELLIDLGSGDGRILIEAARRFGCRATGYEIDPALVAESRRRIAAAGLADRVEVRQDDLRKADFSSAAAVTMYLGERICRELLPSLRSLPPGARLVSHQFGIGVPPDRSERMESAESRRVHVLHLWTAPLR